MYDLNGHLNISYIGYHHSLPVLGELPGAFASTGSVLNANEIVDFLLSEHAEHADDEMYMQAFPRGSDAYLARAFSEILDYLLFVNPHVFSIYTRRLITSVYGLNYPYGLWNAWSIQEKKLQEAKSSPIHSGADCVKRLEEILSYLSHCTDISESMKLPMRVTCKLFSYMSVLLMVPLDDDEDLHGLSELLLRSPQLTAIEQWCTRINDGCKLWPRHALEWRKKLRNISDSSPRALKAKTSWWEWMGWSAHKSQPAETSTFVPDKSHNVLFAMAAVGSLFVFLGSRS